MFNDLLLHIKKHLAKRDKQAKHKEGTQLKSTSQNHNGAKNSLSPDSASCGFNFEHVEVFYVSFPGLSSPMSPFTVLTLLYSPGQALAAANHVTAFLPSGLLPHLTYQ